jgi:ketosteroid isomerase-like protein
MSSLLRDYVAEHNAGVRNGDWSRMLERFADDAELVFEGAPIGPFQGRDEIAAAYRERPPDDEVVVSDVREDGETVVAAYEWRREPQIRAGELRLTHEGDRIKKLVVTFDR